MLLTTNKTGRTVEKFDLADVIRAAGIRPFDGFSGSYNVQAAVQSQTAGITHYYDADALRFFSCKVLKATTFDDGAYMATVCTQDKDGQGSRGYTFQFHACDGRSLGPEDRVWFASKDKAATAMYAFADTLDGRAVVADILDRQERDAKGRIVQAKQARARLRRKSTTINHGVRF